MMTATTPTRSVIREAIKRCGPPGTPRSIEAWSNIAIDDALNQRKYTDDENEKRLFLAIDSVCQGIRWSEMTGRSMHRSFQAPWKETGHIVEAMVTEVLETGDMSPDACKNAWQRLATAHEAAAKAGTPARRRSPWR